jgi:hypothetical protein
MTWGWAPEQFTIAVNRIPRLSLETGRFLRNSALRLKIYFLAVSQIVADVVKTTNPHTDSPTKRPSKKRRW